MTVSLKLTVVVGFFVAVLSKKLHLKEDLDEENKDIKGFMNFFNYEDVFTTKKRYARHMQTVTESVLDHLVSELKQQYVNSNDNSNSPIRRLIRNLSREIKKNEHNKMVKGRQKKKTGNKTISKTGKKFKKMTSEKPPTKHRPAHATKLVN